MVSRCGRRRALALLVLGAAAAPSRAAELEDLAPLLEPVRAAHGAPALAAALVLDGELVALGACGVRRAGGTESVTAADRWHLGSCGKAITATLVARLVERGALRLDATLAELLPGRAAAMHPDFRAVTLRELLAHRAGLPPDHASGGLRALFAGAEEPGTAARLALLDEVLARAPATPPGTATVYSNTGWLLAGALCERVSGASYEAALRAEVLAPLGLASAGFGPPGRDEASSPAPCGHVAGGAGPQPLEPAHPLAAHPPRYAPAGDVHLALADWARLARVHLGRDVRTADGERFLAPDTLAALHAPVAGGEHACGFVVVERPWARGPVLAHHGSSAGWHAAHYLARTDGTALLVACNLGGAAGERVVRAALAALAARVERGVPAPRPTR